VVVSNQHHHYIKTVWIDQVRLSFILVLDPNHPRASNIVPEVRAMGVTACPRKFGQI
jgi:hypothetical protein